MEDQQAPLSPQEQSKKRKAEMKEQAMDMMFGKNRHQYEGNIWGWKFSMISLIGLLLVTSLVAIGVATGNISLDEQVQKAKEAQKEKAEKEKARREEKADSLKKLRE